MPEIISSPARAFFWLFSFLLVFPCWANPPNPTDPPQLKILLESAEEQRLVEDPMWLRLLHMKRGWFRKWKSDIDGTEFFLSPRGRISPEAELEATLRFFLAPFSPTKPEDQAPPCRYPARWDWLKEKLPALASLSPSSCDRFDSWKNKLAPTSLSLVFASYYMNNPASMYGHTFLRLGRQGKTGDERLLDYTINFSAQTTTNNGFLFALLGLTGGFRGVFSTEPYYMKVQKYNNLESRDLWEYSLALSQGELNRVVNHLWELGPTSIAYYFLNKNCSYQLLPLLEVARPHLQLSNAFSIRAIPLDTMKTIFQVPGFVTGSTFRPSHLRRLREGRSRLTTVEKKYAKDLSKQKGAIKIFENSNLSPSRRALVLDVAYDLLRYEHGFYRDQSSQIKEIEAELLKARSVQPSSTEVIHPPLPPAPEAAHGTGRLGFGFGSTKKEIFQEFAFRGSLHDIEAKQDGFVEGSQLEMAHFRARYHPEKGKLHLEEGTLIQIKSLSAWEEWVRVPSWGLRMGFNTAHDMSREPQDTLHFGVRGGSGVTLPVTFLPHGLFYSLFEADVAMGGVFRRDKRLGAGGTSGLVFNIAPWWRAHFSASYLRYGVGNIGSNNALYLKQAFPVGKNGELRLNVERQNNYQEIMGTAHYYF